MIAFPFAHGEDAASCNSFITRHWTEDLAFNLTEGLLDNFLMAQVPIWSWIEYPDACLSAAVGITAITVKEEPEALSPLQHYMLMEYLKEWDGIPIHDTGDRDTVEGQGSEARRVAAALGLGHTPESIGVMLAGVLSRHDAPPANIHVYRELVPKSVWDLLELHPRSQRWTAPNGEQS